MLLAAVVTVLAAPWRLTCLRCTAVVTITDAVCPTGVQAFSD
jgi:hypothetical protein